MECKLIRFLNEEADYFRSKLDDYIYETDKNIFTDEEKVCSKGRNLKDDERGKIHNSLYPVSVLGDLEKGKIFLCLLNPGFNDIDYADETIIRTEIIRQLKQDDASMFCLKSNYKNTSAGQYWRRKLDQKDKRKSLVQLIIKEYIKNGVTNVDEEVVFNMLSRLFVDLELFPYHSKRFVSRKTKELKDKDKSIGIMLSFIHEVLIPNASKNNQLICFLRSIDEWEITNDEKSMINNVFINPTNNRQSCSFNPDFELGKRIFDHIGYLTDGYTKLI